MQFSGKRDDSRFGALVISVGSIYQLRFDSFELVTCTHINF